jgi:hypothetical protein
MLIVGSNDLILFCDLFFKMLAILAKENILLFQVLNLFIFIDQLLFVFFNEVS